MNDININVKIDIPDLRDLIAVIRDIVVNRADMATTVATNNAAAGVKKAAAPKVVGNTGNGSKPLAEAAAPAVIAANPVSTSAPVICAATTDTAAPQALTYAVDVAPTMMRLLTEKGAPAVSALLAKFGVKKGGELPADKLADALAEAKALING